MYYFWWCTLFSAFMPNQVHHLMYIYKGMNIKLIFIKCQTKSKLISRKLTAKRLPNIVLSKCNTFTVICSCPFQLLNLFCLDGTVNKLAALGTFTQRFVGPGVKSPVLRPHQQEAGGRQLCVHTHILWKQTWWVVLIKMLIPMALK